MIVFVAAQGEKGVVLTGEWLQFLTKLNSYTSTWGSARYKIDTEAQLTNITGMGGGDFAYINGNGNLWMFNGVSKVWQKVGFVLS